MNLKEALKWGKLKQFAKEHENKDPHPMGKERFDQLMELMVRGVGGQKAPTPEVRQRSKPSK
jgi:hypothetical protein